MNKIFTALFSVSPPPPFVVPAGVIKLKYLPLANVINIEQEAQGKAYNIIYGFWKWQCVQVDKCTM